MANILVADDDDILVDLIRFRLQGAGHHVISAGDGEIALNHAVRLVPDLIVLDAMMPLLSEWKCSPRSKRARAPRRSR